MQVISPSIRLASRGTLDDYAIKKASFSRSRISPSLVPPRMNNFFLYIFPNSFLKSPPPPVCEDGIPDDLRADKITSTQHSLFAVFS